MIIAEIVRERASTCLLKRYGVSVRTQLSALRVAEEVREAVLAHARPGDAFLSASSDEALQRHYAVIVKATV